MTEGTHAPLTSAEARTLELHRAIGEKLASNPEAVLARARKNLQHQRSVDSGHSIQYLDAWEQLLDGPAASLALVLVSSDQEARDLRQASPLAGVLTDEERIDVLMATDGARVAAASGKSIEELRESLSLGGDSQPLAGRRVDRVHDPSSGKACAR